MARITVSEERFATTATEHEYRSLEAGDILFFPVSPPLLPDEDRAFLVTQKQVDASYHKNISYRPLEDRLKGVEQDNLDQWVRSQNHASVFNARRRFHGLVSQALCGGVEG